jgi:hypothetical protein
MASSAGARPTGWRSPRPAARVLVLLGLWGFACTQPLLAVLGEAPAWFIFRQTGPVAAVVVALAIAVLPPMVLLAVDRVADYADERAGRVVHLATVGGLAALAGHVILRHLGAVHAAASVTLALVLGLGFVLAYRSVELVATWSRYTAVLPLMALLSFLFLSPASAVFWPRSSSGSGSRSEDVASVVFLVLDELPTKSMLDERDQIDPVRFPNLAAFADHSTWYRRHSTVATGTRQAVPSILSGLIPSGEEALMQHHPDNLFTLLRPTHSMRVSESRTWLCAFESCRGGVSDASGLVGQVQTVLADAGAVWGEQVLPGEWREARLDDFEEQLVPSPDAAARPEGMTATAASAPKRFVELLDSIEAPTRPTLWYQHLLMPHQPWHVHPDGTEYDNPDPPRPVGPGRGWMLAMTEQQHLFQAQYTDGLVGQLLDRLEETGVYDDALIVVVADHGINFEPGETQRLWHPDSADGIAFAPLFIKTPGQTEGAIDDQAIMAYDILPTVADILGVDVPWDTDGAPAGSAEITARGDTRTIYDFGPLEDPTPRTTATFDASASFPRADDRAIRTLGPGEPPLLGLVEVARAARWLGSSVDDLTSTVAGTAVIEGLDRIEDATARPPPGFINGRIDGLRTGRVLIAVNGVVVSAAPTFGSTSTTTFRAMLPPDLDELDEIEVRLAWIPGRFYGDDAEIVEVAVER